MENNDSLEDKFIEKAKEFRLHFGLSEDDIDELLIERNLTYSKLEYRKRTLTLELAEAYPLIYGIEYCDFKKDETIPPEFDELPQATQNFIKNKTTTRNKVGLKGTKNKASYVIILVKDFPLGHKFTNSEIIPYLPPPANEDQSIDWGKGLLKGLVENTRQSSYYLDENGEKRREATYQIIKPVNEALLEKAMENVDEGWLKGVTKKKKK